MSSYERNARHAAVAGDGARARSRRRRLVSWRFARSGRTAVHLNPVQARYVEDVARRIALGRYRLEHGACVCGSDDGDVIAQIDRYGIALDTVMCAACGTLRFDPYLSAESLSEFYRFRYQQMYARVPDPDAYFARQRQYGKRLLHAAQATLRPGAIVAEVGCGAGGALAVFEEAGYETHGCDYSAELIAHGVNRGVKNLVRGDVDALAKALASAGKAADLVFLHHVFEHLAAPAGWLESVQRILADDGAIVVAVPDVTGIHRYPSPDGDLRQFLHIAHKFNFSPRGLAALAQGVGLRASFVNAPKSDQAPEMWVSFSRRPRSAGELSGASGGDARKLFRYLRATELDYLRRGVVRRLGRSLETCGVALRRLIASRDSRP